MNLATGGRINQIIIADDGPGLWDTDATIGFNIQILDTASFERITDDRASDTPIDAEEYASRGLEFFSVNEPSTDVAGNLNGDKSVIQTGRVNEADVPQKVRVLGEGDDLEDDILSPCKPLGGRFRSVDDWECLLERMGNVSLN